MSIQKEVSYLWIGPWAGRLGLCVWPYVLEQRVLYGPAHRCFGASGQERSTVVLPNTCGSSTGGELLNPLTLGQQNEVLCFTSCPCHTTDYTNKYKYGDTVFTGIYPPGCPICSTPFVLSWPQKQHVRNSMEVQSTKMWRGQMQCNVLVWAVGLKSS